MRAVCTHPVLSGKAYDRIAESGILEVIVTDSIPLRADRNTEKIKVLSVSKLFADMCFTTSWKTNPSHLYSLLRK